MQKHQLHQTCNKMHNFILVFHLPDSAANFLASLVVPYQLRVLMSALTHKHENI